ncbi:hypothetical protein niasHT_010047 [Heterodera trifolii]|uniref:Uncharacterized protein n=1 Tax=Heterodera trifolii TaxID=157864 RepID=A0ABD2LYV0_9BILA
MARVCVDAGAALTAHQLCPIVAMPIEVERTGADSSPSALAATTPAGTADCISGVGCRCGGAHSNWGCNADHGGGAAPVADHAVLRDVRGTDRRFGTMTDRDLAGHRSESARQMNPMID